MKDVLVDTSVWVEHFRKSNDTLEHLLQQDRILMHPMVLGEIACGTPPARTKTLSDLADLRHAQQPSLSEVMTFIEQNKLYGLGVGLVDMILLACTLMSRANLWTLDKRLFSLAERLGVAHQTKLH
ncbi:PIN domain nuclease [Pseudomonas protegens]|uniref:PIN domain nuclease n=1 Tax=Pseudomonas protegens TaxID=380021 RepID=A0A2T6GBG6_9PSED|nr:PIN domain-containing protein [Pseudomonas protegens]PUA41495.1 PIN domain nuclease [Pseudomonas protegens]